MRKFIDGFTNMVKPSVYFMTWLFLRNKNNHLFSQTKNVTIPTF